MVATLVALLTSGWFLASRTTPGAAPGASASRDQWSAIAADVTRTPTATLGPISSATPGPSLEPVLTPSPRPFTLSPGGTTGPGQSLPPAPSDTAAATSTPPRKSTPTSEALPDLLAIDYGFADAQVVCGEAITVYVVVQNSGQAAVPKGVKVLFQLLEGGIVTGKDDPAIPVELAPLDSSTVKAEFKLAGSCSPDVARMWSFTIDPDNFVPESNEDNNSAAVSFKVAASG